MLHFAVGILLIATGSFMSTRRQHIMRRQEHDDSRAQMTRTAILATSLILVTAGIVQLIIGITG